MSPVFLNGLFWQEPRQTLPQGLQNLRRVWEHPCPLRPHGTWGCSAKCLCPPFLTVFQLAPSVGEHALSGFSKEIQTELSYGTGVAIWG